MKNMTFLFAQVLKGLVIVAAVLIAAAILLPIGTLFQLIISGGLILTDSLDYFVISLLGIALAIILHSIFGRR